MCPPDIHQVLNIKLPFLVIILKSIHTQCHFQVQIVDKDNIRHLIDFSNVEVKKNKSILTPRMHLLLEPGWNKLEIDLCHFTKILNAEFDAVCRLKICASCRIRRIYFMDRRYEDNEMTLGLYHGFLDFYMLKWGIKAIDRATQTRRVPGKLLTLCDSSVRPAAGLNRLFLKHLQTKSDEIVEEYFARQSSKPLKDFLDFKRKAKIKPYVIPDCNNLNKNKSSSDSSLININEIRSSFKSQDSHTKMSYEEKKEEKNKMQTSKLGNKGEIKNSMYKICMYRYPEAKEKKINTVKR
jgi:hypothetical protein